MTPLRPSKTEIDESILDITAGLIGRRGVKDTSVQAIATEAGYSKAGILSRFPSKEALVEGALAQCEGEIGAVLDGLTTMAIGRERDAAALAALTELLLRRTGSANLLLAAVTPTDDDLAQRLYRIAEMINLMFQPPEAELTPQRRARIAGAVGVVIIMSLAYQAHLTDAQAREAIMSISWNALGYEGPFTPAGR